jgi:NADH-quinone oxidoreductase subunit C
MLIKPLFVEEELFFEKSELEALQKELKTEPLTDDEKEEFFFDYLNLDIISNINLNLVNFLIGATPKLIKFFIIKSSFLYIYVFLEYLDVLLKFIKNSNFCLQKLLIDFSVIDYLYKKKRFKLNYSFLSIFLNLRISVVCFVKLLYPAISIIHLYKNSHWLEREVWDMYGIPFVNSLDLRRILTDYGFKYFPLRKDFPLTGYFELRYDETLLNVLYERVELAQELRFFNVVSGRE